MKQAGAHFALTRAGRRPQPRWISGHLNKLTGHEMNPGAGRGRTTVRRWPGILQRPRSALCPEIEL